MLFFLGGGATVMGHVTDEEVNCSVISIYRPWIVLRKHSKEVTASNLGISTSGI